ncbi:PAS domain-containing protein [Psychromonas sp. KJ10-10]|uniref:PAS domain-containing protein n=1 Tax=Psychromonas sp. KJ10-10 TaxID=3391823 RepID=UPI0039B599C9
MFPIFAPSGEISGVVLAFRDTTEEFRAAEELLSSQTLIKTLLNNLPNLIWLKDKNGVFIACNENFSRMYAGGTPEDILGKTDYDFTDKEHADFFRQKDLQALVAGKATRNEEWLTFASDGHCELVETIKTPMSDNNGDLIGVLGIASDITKDRESFAQLRSSELRLKEAQIYAKIGYWELYADSRNYHLVSSNVCIIWTPRRI